MEGKKDINLYFKNGKPRKNPKKIKQEPVHKIVDKNNEIIKQQSQDINYSKAYKSDCLMGKDFKDFRGGTKIYDPPLPVSVVKDTNPSMNIKPNESTCELYNADCLEKMKDLPDKSIDLIFCDLPYGQTSCKWDCKIDLDLFWKQVMRIKKLNTPIFFTTTTKFGVDLIKSAPKKCFFRYDLVWVKSAPAGFLSAKKMPMRKHEMIYVFYEKLPFYDLSSHQHKFVKQYQEEDMKKSLYGKMPKTGKDKESHSKQYDPPLPVSIVKEEIDEKYKNKGGLYSKVSRNGLVKNEPHYEPPLPVSIVKDKMYDAGTYKQEDNADDMYRKMGRKSNESAYEPPLPNTLLEIKSTRGKHSTEKPVALMEWIFKYYSKEGDTILDPTAGSGSTGVACKNMNRNFIGIEMDEDIFNVAKDRLDIKE